MHPEAMAMLAERDDIRYEVIEDVTDAVLAQHIVDADALCIRIAPLRPEILGHARNLRVISRHGVGYDNIPVDACSKLGIAVAIIGPVNAVAVAEHTFFLMLTVARNGIVLDSAMRDGRFSVRSTVQGVELFGKTLLLVGYGNIGRQVASRALSFGMRVCVFDPYLTPDSLGAGIAHVATLDEGLTGANIVSLHLPLTDETRAIIGAPELARLPRGAILVNASRGGLVDETALLAAVRSGALHGAGLDTFVVEPLPKTSPLLSEQRIVVSPHSAALTEDTLIAMGKATVEHALAGIDGTLDPGRIVNRKALAAAGF